MSSRWRPSLALPWLTRCLGMRPQRSCVAVLAPRSLQPSCLHNCFASLPSQAPQWMLEMQRGRDEHAESCLNGAPSPEGCRQEQGITARHNHGGDGEVLGAWGPRGWQLTRLGPAGQLLRCGVSDGEEEEGGYGAGCEVRENWMCTGAEATTNSGSGKGQVIQSPWVEQEGRGEVRRAGQEVL